MRSSTLVGGFAMASLLVATNAFAQFGSVRGKVVDGEGAPVADAAVVIKAPVQALTVKGRTKKDGTFQLLSQTSGPWNITVAKDGYQTWQSTDPVKIPLNGDPLLLPPVTLYRAGDARAPGAATAAAAGRSEGSAKFNAATDLLTAADAARQSGDSALAAQKLDAAEGAFQEMLDKNPTDAAASFNMALVYERKSQWEKAAEAYMKAAELKPDMVEASIGAGAAYINAGQLPKGTEVLEAALQKSPADPRLQELLALARYNGGIYDEARKLFEQVTESAPANAEPYYYLGMIAVTQNRAEDAAKLLEKYVSMNPADARNLKTAEGVLAALKKKS